MTDDSLTRLQTDGASSLSTPELLAVVLGGRDALTLAEALLQEMGGLQGLARCDVEDLRRLSALSSSQRVRLLAALGLAVRYASSAHDERLQVESASDAARLLAPEMERLKQEQLRAVLLDAGRRVMGVTTVYIGSLNVTVVRVAEVFREAIARNAASIILAHNHPSGDPTPSPADLSLTETLIEAGNLLDIPLLDHLIIGQGRWISLRDTGLGFR